MNPREIELRIIVGSRFFTVLAVMGSLAASVLMFFLGLYNVLRGVPLRAERYLGATTRASSAPLR